MTSVGRVQGPAAHLMRMTEPTSTARTTDAVPGSFPDFNDKQRRFAKFAARKSCRWSAADFDSRVLIIETLSERSNRSLALYRSGTTGHGVKVALIDPSMSADKGLKFISQRDAWALLAEGRL